MDFQKAHQFTLYHLLCTRLLAYIFIFMDMDFFFIVMCYSCHREAEDAHPELAYLAANLYASNIAQPAGATKNLCESPLGSLSLRPNLGFIYRICSACT